MWCCALAIPALEKWRQKDQAFTASIINTDSEANLDYRRPILNATKSTNKIYLDRKEVLNRS